MLCLLLQPATKSATTGAHVTFINAAKPNDERSGTGESTFIYVRFKLLFLVYSCFFLSLMENNKQFVLNFRCQTCTCHSRRVYQFSKVGWAATVWVIIRAIQCKDRIQCRPRVLLCIPRTVCIK